MNLDFLYNSYKGGGRASYHPKMMLKVILYAYTQKIYTSRQIAKALRENVNFMWLSGNNRPDFRTINKFRKEKLSEHLPKIFSLLLYYLYEKGYVNLNNYFLDGTKIEANANKYSFVWSKSIKYFKNQLYKNVKKLLKEIEELNKEEDKIYQDKDLEELGEESYELTSDELEKIAKELEDIVEEKPEKKELKKKLKKIKTNYLPGLKKYEKHEHNLNGRNSYSKTDKDATFMRMKEDAMLNGQLKAGYNVQIGTQNQFILWYSIHQEATDTNTLSSHLSSLETNTGFRPLNLIADAGYGSTYNYLYLKKQGINIYVKYPLFFKETKKRFKKQKFNRQNWAYDSVNDAYICPSGEELKYAYKRKRIKRKKLEFYKVYITNNCSNCIFNKECAKGKGYKKIYVNPVYEKLKEEVKKIYYHLMVKNYQN